MFYYSDRKLIQAQSKINSICLLCFSTTFLICSLTFSSVAL